jgi:hypothetical protein
MIAIKTARTAERDIVPSETSSNTDFDFFHGKWKIHNRKLKSRLTNCDEWIEFDAEQECSPILNEFGNQDFFHAEFDGKPFEATAIRLFNPKTRLWSIYWADSNVVVMDTPQVGSFDGATGVFLGRDVIEGTPVIVKFHWDIADLQNPVWSQAFSTDEGTTWERNWYMHFSKA